MSNIGLSAPRRGVVGVLALDPSPRFVGVPGREGSGGGFNFVVVVRDRASVERADLYFFVGFGAVARDCLFSSETPREDMGRLGVGAERAILLDEEEEDILNFCRCRRRQWCRGRSGEWLNRGNQRRVHDTRPIT